MGRRSRNAQKEILRKVEKTGSLQKITDVVQSTQKLEKSVRDKVGYSLEWVEEKTLGSKTSERLSQGSRFFQIAAVQWIANLWHGFLQAAERLWITRQLVKPLRWGVRSCVLLGDFALSWIWSRNYWHLFGGVPAFLLMMPLAYCALRIPFYTPELKARHYQMAARSALDKEDFDAANLYYRKLSQLGVQNERVVFDAALNLARENQFAQARSEMEKISPLDRPGFVPGHIWLADSLLRDPHELEQTERIRLAQQHLQHALDREPSHQRAQNLMAQIYLASGQLDQANQILDAASKTSTDNLSKLSVAEISLRAGRVSSANQIARDVIADLEPRMNSDEPDQVISAAEFLAYAVALNLVGENSDAIHWLQEGVKRFPDNQMLSENLVRMRLQDYDRRALGDFSPEDRLSILSELIELDAKSEPVIVRLVALLHATEIQTQVAQLVSDRIDIASLTIDSQKTVAALAVLRGDMLAARDHFATILKRVPNDADTVNNLAWLYAHQEPLDLDKAIEFANKAVSLAPDNPHYLDTRGSVYLVRREWQKAITDLESALNGIPDKPEIHQGLAQAYREIGNLELSEIHQRIVDRSDARDSLP
ncbi:MAG: tetratricopeptide repeat protein [Pirellulaceae bacterium]